MSLTLSKEEEYGILALVDLAYNLRGRRVQVKELARRQRIPGRFLEQIFSKFQRANIVDGKRGPRGGYCLSRDPSQIKLEEILGVLRPKLKREGRTDETALSGLVERVWSEVEGSLSSTLQSVSLDDMCKRARELGIRESDQAAS